MIHTWAYLYLHSVIYIRLKAITLEYYATKIAAKKYSYYYYYYYVSISIINIWLL